MRRVARLLKLMTGSLLLLLPIVLHAQHMSVSVTPTPSWLAPYHPDITRKPDLREVDNGYYEVLYEEQHHVEKQAVYRHVVRRIVTGAGVQNGAEISVDYRPAYERLYFHQVQLRRNGQVISILDPSKFKFVQQEKDLAQYIYTGTGTALLFPEDVRKGDELEYAYSVVGRNPIFENKYFNSFYFTTDDPVLNYYCALIVSPQRVLSFNAMNDAPEPEERQLNGNTLYEWKLGDSVKVNDDNDGGYPYVQVTEYNSWQQVIDWAKRINYTAASGKNILGKIAELKAAAGKDTMKYITGAIRFVQDDIRYMGIEMGEYSHRPNDPDKVLSQRFGDCKDKSLLLSTILKAQGVKAYMAYVNTYLEDEVSDLEPTPFAFNHCIVKMDFHGREYWIDPTIAYQRGPLDKRSSLPYGAALVIGDGSEALSFIENKNYGVMKVWEQYYLSPDNYRTTLLKVKTDYTGSYADEVRAQFAATSVGSQERSYRSFYGKTYTGVTVKDSLRIEDKEEDNIFRIYESYGIGQAWVYDTAANNGTLSFNSNVRSLAEEIPYITSAFQKTSLALKYPTNIEYEVELHLPIAWTTVPNAVHVRNEYFRYDFDASVRGTVMTLKYKYETFADMIPFAHISEYVGEVAQIAASVNLMFTYNPGGALDRPSIGGNVIGGWNWLMLGLAVFFIIVFAGMGWLYYQRSMLPLKTHIDPHPINGWLVLLGIGIAFRPFYLLLSLAGMDTFYYNTWVEVTKLAGSGNPSLLQLGLAIMVLCQTMLFVYSVLLCFLFFGRRDTFPGAMIAFYIIQVIVFACIRLMPAALLSHQTLVHEGVTEIIVLLMAALWIPYLLASKRVKATFVFPHASRVSYSIIREEEEDEQGPTNINVVDTHIGVSDTQISNDPLLTGEEDDIVTSDDIVEGLNEQPHVNAVVGNGQSTLANETNANVAGDNVEQSPLTNGAIVNGRVSAAGQRGAVNGHVSAEQLPLTNGVATNGHVSMPADIAEQQSLTTETRVATTDPTILPSAADDILATIQAMKSENGNGPPEKVSTDGDAEADQQSSLPEQLVSAPVQPAPPSLSVYAHVEDLNPEAAPADETEDTAADNILKTIRFLHALRSQEGSEMDKPNILLLNEEREEKKDRAADNILATIKAMKKPVTLPSDYIPKNTEQ